MTPRLFLTTALLGTALFSAAPAIADDHSAAPVVELPSGPEGPALWKVSDEDTTIYLFVL